MAYIHILKVRLGLRFQKVWLEKMIFKNAVKCLAKLKFDL
jgi:hypothetical protein